MDKYFFLRNKRKNKLFMLVILINFLSNEVFSYNIIDSIDLMPFSKDVDVREITLKNHNEWANLFKNNSTQEFDFSSNLHSSIGFYLKNSSKFGIGLNASLFEEPLSRTLSPYEIFSDDIIINLKVIYPHRFFFLDKWKTYTNFIYKNSPKKQFYCFEMKSYIVGGNNLNCTHPSKSIYVSKINNKFVNALEYKSNSFSFESGIRNSYYNFDYKRINELGFFINYDDNDIKFGNGFKSADLNYINKFPSNKSSLDQALKFSSRFSKSINNSWALGTSLTGFLLDTDKFYKKVDSNVILEVKLTKKFANKYFLSFGGSTSKNPIMLQNNISQIPYNSNLINSSLSYLYLKIGSFNYNKEYYKSEPSVKNINEIIKVLEDSIIENETFNRKKILENKELISKSNNNLIDKKNKKITLNSDKLLSKENGLLNFALEYAKNYDKQKTIVF